MTQEEKAKAYDEALKKARQLCLYPTTGPFINDLQDLFPELKESEDERIRKTLLRFHKSTIDIDGIKGDDILAWLEKQGKQPSAIRWYDVSLIPQEMEELLVEWDSEDATWHEIAFYHADTKTFWNSTRQVENVTRWCYIIDLLEKQGEQKTSVLDFKAEDWCVSKVDGKIHNIYNSVAKVEPKFKVGDWVIYMGTTAKILDLQKHCYVGKDTNDKDFVVSYCNEYAMKKWDISYAKDGDVLASDNSIFIFQEEYISEKPIAYCGLMNGCFIVDGEDACWTNERYYPATKEQCNTLFAKMKEAGYEWNEETHELKKIEDEEYNGEDYGIDGLWHAQRILEKTLGKVEGYQTDDGFLSHQCAITAVKKLYKQKPAWSEEDECYMAECINAIATKDGWSFEEKRKTKHWLKSLKQRIGG